eukprot:152734-Pyramimonas_sp.AAC.1
MVPLIAGGLEPLPLQLNEMTRRGLPHAQYLPVRAAVELSERASRGNSRGSWPSLANHPGLALQGRGAHAPATTLTC